MTALFSRVAVEWRLKLACSLAFNIVFWAVYGLTGHHAFFPLRTVPFTWLDANVPYLPGFWGWVYLSQFIYTSLIPWLLESREEVLRCVKGLCLMSAASFFCFLFYPVMAPRPGDMGAAISMRVIAGYDGLLNAFPSLHAGFLCYIALLAWRMFGRTAPLVAVMFAAAWGAAVMYATLATKQHYVADLVAGGIIGWISYTLAWRGAVGETAASTIPRKSGMTSQAGSR